MKFKVWLRIVIHWVFVAVSASGWLFGPVTNTHQHADDSDLDHVEGSSSEETISSTQNVGGRFPFELNTMDDRFLLQATIAREMSPLDACHHGVVAELEGTCGDLSEEDIAKLSVRLLNCQSEVEKRRVYQCTSDMTIHECTVDMDPTTWNAYQIVSNRARAICYAVRQQQFRLSTEMTVNRLVESSHIQLLTLKTLNEGQEHIRSVAEDTVEKVETGHKRITEYQVELERVHSDIRTKVLDNIQTLRREKQVITSENKQLLEMTEEIRRKLDLTSAQIEEQTSSQSVRHSELLDDLAGLGSRADVVSSKLDNSAAAADSLQHSLTVHHVTALDSLKQINETIDYLLSMADSFRVLVDTKFEWLHRLADSTDDRVLVLSSVVLHCVYFIASICVLAALRLSILTRYFLLLAVCANATAEINQVHCFSFAQLTAVVGVFVVGDLVRLILLRILMRRRSKWNGIANTGNCIADAGEHVGLTLAEIQRVVKALESLVVMPSSDGDNTIERVGKPFAAIPGNPVECNTPPRESSFSTGHFTPPQIQRLVLPLTPKLTNPPSTPSFGGDDVSRDIVTRFLRTGARTPSSVCSSPAGSTYSSSSTPTRHRSRSRGLNLSSTRPICEGLTKTGQPCKLQCQDGSEFCHRHHRD